MEELFIKNETNKFRRILRECPYMRRFSCWAEKAVDDYIGRIFVWELVFDKVKKPIDFSTGFIAHSIKKDYWRYGANKIRG